MQVGVRGRVAVVTGANTGIGRVTAHELARAGAEVYLACRTRAKADPVIREIRSDTGNEAVHFVELDLASFASVHGAAKRLLELGKPIHLLVNNAGMAGRGQLTADGFQWTFGVNHLGHFLLTEKLRDRLDDGGRVICVASRAHYQATEIDWELLRKPVLTSAGMPEYAVSKLCNVLHAKALARRVGDRGITTYSLHPGVVATDVWRQIPWPFQSAIKWFMLSEADGAKTTLHCALDEGAGRETGLYYDSSRVRTPSTLALDEALAEELWERSAAWVA